jgi:hypothetical protein
MNIFRKIKKLFAPEIPKNKKWETIEYFDITWKNRIRQMAEYIPENSLVIDLGCGEMWLRDYIKNGRYFPVDYKKRDDTTIVCDFNKYEFPSIKGDVAFVAGCLEYVKDYKWFIKMIAAHTNTCIISYCSYEEISDLNTRRSLAWVNQLKKHELVDIFKSNEMNMTLETKYNPNNNIFVFKKKK